jgi:hypothetical protein
MDQVRILGVVDIYDSKKEIGDLLVHAPDCLSATLSQLCSTLDKDRFALPTLLSDEMVRELGTS